MTKRKKKYFGPILTKCTLVKQLMWNTDLNLLLTYSRFSINSEANASELIENVEETFPRYMQTVVRRS